MYHFCYNSKEITNSFIYSIVLHHNNNNSINNPLTPSTNKSYNIEQMKK